MSNFISLNSALSALQAARIRIDTAAHNVANVATRGYTRQLVNLTTTTAFDGPYGQIGTGVRVESVARARDAFLDARIRAASSSYNELSARSDLLSRSEQVLAEPDQGVTERMSDLWFAFEELGLSPANSGARIAVMGALEDMAARVRTVWSGWETLGQDTSTRLRVTVTEVNDLLAATADLNKQISAASHDVMPNELLDARDLLVDRLSERIGATAIDSGNGMIRISLDGLGLVDGLTVRPLTYNSDNTISHASGQTVRAGGEIAGYQRFLAQDLPNLQADLNAFTRELSDALNDQHAAGYASDGTAGGPLLSYVTGSEARTLSVAIDSPDDLAVSDDPGPPFPTYNGNNAQRLGALRTTLVASGGTETLDSLGRSLAIDLGASVAASERAAGAQRGLVTAAQLAREGQHGVSLDEEMAYLVEAQHAYEAAARVMTAVDETLDMLIKRTGLVGR